MDAISLKKCLQPEKKHREKGHICTEKKCSLEKKKRKLLRSFFLLYEIYLRVSVHLCCAICVLLPFQLRCNDGNKQSGKIVSARTKRNGTNVRVCERRYC